MRLRWRLDHQAQPQRGVPTAIVMFGIFATLALVTRLLCIDQVGSSSFWPANSALVVAILVLPKRLAVCTSLACFVANILLNQMTSYTGFDNVLFSTLNIAMSYLTAFLTRSLCGAATDLSRMRRLSTFACIAVLSAGVEAAIGDSLTHDTTPGFNALTDWLQWTLCDSSGLLLATPAILLAVKSFQTDLACDAPLLERWLLLAGTFVLAMAGFIYAKSPLFLLVYPALILTAFRAGPAWVLASVLLTSIIASAMTAHGHGPIALLSPSGSLLRQDMMQPYLLSLFLAAIPANNALGEKNRSARRLRRLKAALEHSATHDGLTTLVNRDLFQRRLAAMLQSGSSSTVFLIDLDRFKQVNDTLGHQAGDELLRAFSNRLVASLPPGATTARFGGDEFAVLVPRLTGCEDVERTCEIIVQAGRSPFDLARGQVHVSASVGVAAAGGRESETGEVMRRADIALYAVKAAGCNGYRVFSGELDNAVRERAALEADLRVAVEGANGLSLHYQPKFDRDGALLGVEALLRWHHPRLGVIPPPRFICIAEETGLIRPLGAWVFREALAFAERWPQLNVAINVSPVQLRDPQFVADTLALLRTSPVPAERLELEVTETALMDEAHPATGRLACLRNAGLRIALDDFGTGYSSLRHLHRFTVDRVKIDQSFVRSLGESFESAAIVKAVISLGHAMGLQVTAEGVETGAQRDYLVEAGIDELQGYYLARPMKEAALAATLVEQALVTA